MDNHSNTLILTNYIESWGWHILGVLFFLKSLSFLIVREYIWMFGMIGVFCFCEIIVFKRKLDMEKQWEEIEDGE